MTIKFGFQWKGIAADERMRRGGTRGLRLGAEHVLGVARQRVPLEEGTLERSGVASVDGKELRAAISFDTPYAVVQHEDLELKHDEGRQAKYLESALSSDAETVQALIAAEIRRELDG